MLRKPSPPPALTQLLPTDRLSAELRGVQQRASNELRGGRLEASRGARDVSTSSKVRAVAEFSLDAAMAAVGTSVGGRKVRSNEQAVDAEFSLDAALTALGDRHMMSVVRELPPRCSGKTMNLKKQIFETGLSLDRLEG